MVPENDLVGNQAIHLSKAKHDSTEYTRSNRIGRTSIGRRGRSGTWRTIGDGKSHRPNTTGTVEMAIRPWTKERHPQTPNQESTQPELRRETHLPYIEDVEEYEDLKNSNYADIAPIRKKEEGLVSAALDDFHIRQSQMLVNRSRLDEWNEHQTLLQKKKQAKKEDEGNRKQNPFLNHNMGSKEDSVACRLRDLLEEEDEIRKRRRDVRRQLEETELEDEMLAKTGDWAFNKICGDWDGCGHDKHREIAMEHEAKSQGDHRGLIDTWKRDGAENTSPLGSDVGLYVEGFPRKAGIDREAYPDAETLQDQFEGVSTSAADTSTQPPRICLHREDEDSQGSLPYITPNTDSLIIIANSLGVFLKDVYLCFVHSVARNIQSPLHLPVEVSLSSGDGNPVTKLFYLNEVPHIYAGFLEGWPLGAVYFAFPRMASPDQANNYITLNELAQFYDEVIYPAIWSFIIPTSFPSLPRSQFLAELNARAKAAETTTDRKEARQMQHFQIPLKYNAAIWQEMMSLIKTKRLDHFQDMFIVFDIKNLKNQTSTTLDLYDSMESFDERLAESFDDDYVIEMALDLAVSIGPESPQPRGPYSDIPAVTYLWRRCCIDSFFDSLVKDHWESKKGKTNVYTAAGLYDSCSISIEPPRSSYFFGAGLRYIQQYNQVKLLLEANGVFPLQSESILELAVDPQTWTLAAARAKVTNTKKREHIENKYAHGKERVKKATKTDYFPSFPARFEIRVLRPLWRAIKRRAKRHREQNGPRVQLQFRPESVWAVNTRTFAHYVAGNYNKYMSLLEMCSTTSPRQGRSLERTRFMRVVIECLQQFWNTIPGMYPALWWSSKRRDDKEWFGLGFEDTMREYGYCWIQPGIVDWNTIQFTADVRESIKSLDNRKLLSWFPGTGSLLEEGSTPLSRFFDYLEQSTEGGLLRAEILVILAHKCFKYYRDDVWDGLRKEIRDVARARIKADEIQFSRQGFEIAITSRLNWITGRVLADTPIKLFNWIWGYDTRIGEWEPNRAYILSKPYRQYLDQVNRTIIHKLPMLQAQWENTLYREFWNYHWAVPYPHTNGTLIAKPKPPRGQQNNVRQMYAVQVVDGRSAKFVWAKKNVLSEEVPPPYPKSCALSEEHLREYLRKLYIQDKFNDKGVNC